MKHKSIFPSATPIKTAKGNCSPVKLDSINWPEKTNAWLIYVKSTLHINHDNDEETKESATLPTLLPVTVKQLQ
jgi:hypothetical protein